jgi:uncharacterized protein YoxC
MSQNQNESFPATDLNSSVSSLLAAVEKIQSVDRAIAGVDDLGQKIQEISDSAKSLQGKLSG